MKASLVWALGLVLLSMVPELRGQVPSIINYQGRVVTGTTNFNGSGLFKFALVNAAGSTTYWSNDGTSTAGSQPAAAVALTVTNGLYSVLLGNTTMANMSAIPTSVFNNGDVHLRVWFNDGVNGSQLLAPDQRIAAVGYAMIAAGVPSGAITNAMIADGAVTGAKVATGTITGSNVASGTITGTNIASGAVGSTQLGTNAVQSANIAPGAVAFSDLAKPPQSGSFASTTLAVGPIMPFSVTFPSSFGSAPVVTTTLASPIPSAISTLSVWVTGVSATSFSGNVLDPGASLSRVPVNLGFNAGRHASFAIVNGRPAVAYGDDARGNLRYVRANNAAGSSWGTPVVVGGITTLGAHASLKIVNGNPAIAYGGNSGASFVRASDVDGTTWGTPVTVGSFSRNTSLEVVNGNPAISYTNIIGFAVQFVRATNVNGTAWGSPVTIESVGTSDAYASLEVINGNPAISYFTAFTNDLKYARATDVNGTTWGTPLTLDSPGNVGFYTSLAVISGNPAVSYTDSSSSTLRYVRAADVNGATWNSPVTAASLGIVSQHTSLTTVNGNPAISYYDATNSALRYARSSDILGISWGSSVIVDNIADVGQYASLGVANGVPAISYYDATTGDLKFAFAIDANGVMWSGGAQFIVDDGDPQADSGRFPSMALISGMPAIASVSDGISKIVYVRATAASGQTWGNPVALNAGLYPSLLEVNGNPAVAYYIGGGGDLMYMRANDATGTAWGAAVMVDGSSGNIGHRPSLVIVAGFPAISYHDASNTSLKYARATEVNGNMWATPITIDNAGDEGSHSSMAIVNGLPAIAYYSGTVNAHLKYVRATVSDGSVWGTPVIVDPNGNVGLFPSLKMVNGNPAISYYDSSNGSNGDVKYVRASDANGSAWGTPLTLDSAGDVGESTSLSVVDGVPAVSYYDKTNGNLKYVKAQNASGTAWNGPRLLDGAASVVGVDNTSMIYFDGKPAISFYDETNQDLKFVRWTDVDYQINWIALPP